jgi:hypothetical protein
MNAPVEQGAAWRDLLTREYFPKLATMALALWLRVKFDVERNHDAQCGW